MPRPISGSFTLRRGDRLGHYLSATGKKKNAGHDLYGGRSLHSSFCPTRGGLRTEDSGVHSPLDSQRGGGLRPLSDTAVSSNGLRAEGCAQKIAGFIHPWTVNEAGGYARCRTLPCPPTGCARCYAPPTINPHPDRHAPSYRQTA